MRRLVLSLPLLLAGLGLSGCETAGYYEGPVEYAVRPDYRDTYRRPPPPPIYGRYDRYGDIYDRPPPPPRPYRPYGGYGGYGGYRGDYDRYDRY